MTNKEFNDVMLKVVVKGLETENKEMIEKLCANISIDDTLDEKYVKMITNTVYYSIQKSVECILEILEEIQVVNPQNIQMSPESLSALNLRRLK